MSTDVREALADEREKFEAWPFFAKMNDAAREYAWRAWQARAALAAPSQAEPVDAADLAQLNGALVRSRDGYISEAATGLPALAQWRSETLDWLDAGLATVARLKAASPKPAQAEPEGWQRLYRRAINEANGLTNYVEDRPELRSAERRIAKIEEEARALAAAPKRTEG